MGQAGRPQAANNLIEAIEPSQYPVPVRGPLRQVALNDGHEMEARQENGSTMAEAENVILVLQR